MGIEEKLPGSVCTNSENALHDLTELNHFFLAKLKRKKRYMLYARKGAELSKVLLGASSASLPLTNLSTPPLTFVISVNIEVDGAR
ncbi:hypothetical protein CDAR_128641 [Caerostris darwini]|uniref:Uncharacterized protein n=1 Tax=Caerostris darwini TaxID=1538125 RepID=A0AAV4NIH8_9ARAC|nr:hypothetical protein CDAR_128641 [Caerostris darwini]